MAKCINCSHLKMNPEYDYMTNDKVAICNCTIESDFYPGDINALGFEEEIKCEDFEKK